METNKHKPETQRDIDKYKVDYEILKKLNSTLIDFGEKPASSSSKSNNREEK